jgi:hypothetical protein
MPNDILANIPAIRQADATTILPVTARVYPQAQPGESHGECMYMLKHMLDCMYTHAIHDHNEVNWKGLLSEFICKAISIHQGIVT